MDIELLRERARIIKLVRTFFNEKKQYLETDTPLLAPDLIPESCLEVFETKRLEPQGSMKQARSYWLIPSPEIWMKRLISQHKQNIFQICKCFRNGESSGKFHSPEFTMLEYYTMNADYADSLKITEELFTWLLVNESGAAWCGNQNNFSAPFVRLTIEEAFSQFAGFSLFDAAEDPAALEKEAARLGLNPMSGLTVQQLYDLIFIHSVEPSLPKDKPVVLMDYPAFVPCLAKKKPDNKTVERWELYIDGIELANCFSEETSADEVKNFFEKEKTEKDKHALIRHSVDENYWKMFQGTPQCSGVAMGLDRLIMVLCGRSTIDSVLPFPMN